MVNGRCSRPDRSIQVIPTGWSMFEEEYSLLQHLSQRAGWPGVYCPDRLTMPPLHDGYSLRSDGSSLRSFWCCLGIAIGTLSLGTADMVAAEKAHATTAARLKAMASITHLEVKEHVNVLADDRFEGRDSGSRGGRAAAGYLLEQIKRAQLQPAGDRQTYFQSFPPGYRNVLALLPGSDPQLQKELIICSAHYDHVGYGTRETSRGPLGWIHNGADDNASGVSGVLEVLEAFHEGGIQPARSVLFAFWDGEEKGLLGSRHWIANSTLPQHRVVAVFNIDMIGRSTAQQLEIHGSRSAPGWRQRLVELNPAPSPLHLRFPWKLEDNSDHFPFYAAGIPVLMFHTGLHKDYHTPHDDVEHINTDSLHHITQLAFTLVEQLANDPQPMPTYRPESKLEQQEPVWLTQMELPARLGLAWEEPPVSREAETPAVENNRPSLRVRRVTAGSPADQAGLRVGDQLIAVNGSAIDSSDQLQLAIATAEQTIELSWQSDPSAAPTTRSIALRGGPVRLGMAWKRDAGEPHTVIVSAVRAGSPAQRSDLRPLDRIHRINGQAPLDDDQVLELIQSHENLSLDLERDGQLMSLTVELPPVSAAPSVATRPDMPRVQ